MSSPHLRAKLGQLLYYIFLPASENQSGERYTDPPKHGGNAPYKYLLGVVSS